MPVVLFLPILCLVVGLSAALAAREQIARGDSLWRGTHLPGVTLLAVMVVVPFGCYLYFSNPAWAMLYWWEPLDLTHWHVLWIALGAPAACALGYLVGGALCRFLRPAAALVACAAGVIGLGAGLWFTGDRLLRLSDTREWQDAPSVFSGDLAVVFAFALPMMLGAWVFLLVLYEVEGRKLQRASGIRASDRPVEPFSLPPASGQWLASAADGLQLAEPRSAEASGLKKAGQASGALPKPGSQPKAAGPLKEA